MNDEKRCEFIIKDGKRCTSWKQHGSDFCFKHTQTPEERRLSARQGGLSGTITPEIMGLGKRIEIKKPRHIRKALVNTLNLLKEGKIEPVTANCIGYLCGIIIKNFELIEMDERMREIERKLGIESDAPDREDQPIDARSIG